MVRQKEEEDGTKLAETADIDCDFDEVAQQLASHDWAQFAILDVRQSEIAPGHSEQASVPPSDEAIEHLNCAIDKAQKIGREVRKVK